jgi:hypothetical protein
MITQPRAWRGVGDETGDGGPSPRSATHADEALVPQCRFSARDTDDKGSRVRVLQIGILAPAGLAGTYRHGMAVRRGSHEADLSAERLILQASSAVRRSA